MADTIPQRGGFGNDGVFIGVLGIVGILLYYAKRIEKDRCGVFNFS
jgi:hypothetical protein